MKCVMNGENLDYNEIDPGVRETVRWLRERHGFDTFDSGDGVSRIDPNLEDHEQLWGIMPHVGIRCEPEELISVADRLAAVCAEVGIEITPYEDDPNIQATYNPAWTTDLTARGVVYLQNVNDELLASLGVIPPLHVTPKR